MKHLRNKLFVFAGVAVMGLAIFIGIRAVSKPTQKPEAAFLLPPETSERQSPADRQIRAAQKIIERSPARPEGYNLLCTAYMQKARETADFSFNARAESALKRSFEVAPDNYQAIKLEAKLLLVFHRFGDALEAARRATGMQPQDYDAYGALVDALVELGEYDQAVEAAQTMVDLRPYTASYARVSYLRALYGDTEGAIEAMSRAVNAASSQDPEGLAWCLVHLGDELMNAGRMKEAEREYDRALYIFPDYYLALAAKARARVAAGDTAGAVQFYTRAQERVPLPDVAIALGDLLTKLGRTEEAKRQYDLLEFIERSGDAAGAHTYSLKMALFWADHDIKLDEALKTARRERAARRDIYTCDALAWALYKKGLYAEAKSSMDEALRLGTRDARLFYHAGMISDALGDRRTAAKYLRLAFEINPVFDVLQAEVARQKLANLDA